MKNTLKYKLLGLLVVAPSLAFAYLNGLKTLLGDIKGLVGMLYPIVYGIAFVYFFWGVAQFILNDAGSDKTREEGKQKMLWGVIALFVMVSISGIINLIGSTVDVEPVWQPGSNSSVNAGSSGSYYNAQFTGGSSGVQKNPSGSTYDNPWQ